MYKKYWSELRKHDRKRHRAATANKLVYLSWPLGGLPRMGAALFREGAHALAADYVVV